MNTALAIFLGSLLATSTAFATTYVRVEKDGTKTYSDRPLPGGQAIDLKPAQTYSAQPAPSNTNIAAEPADATGFHYESCALSPRNDETFQSPESVTLSLTSTPNLRYSDRVRFLVDGADVGGSGPSASMSMPDRGSHTVNANVTDLSGRVLCTATTTFHVQRPTLNSPTRVPPPRPNPPNPPRPTPH